MLESKYKVGLQGAKQEVRLSELQLKRDVATAVVTFSTLKAKAACGRSPTLGRSWLVWVPFLWELHMEVWPQCERHAGSRRVAASTPPPAALEGI